MYKVEKFSYLNESWAHRCYNLSGEMNSIVYFILLLGTWFYYFLIYLHLDWSWLLPAYKNSNNVKEMQDIRQVYDYIIVGAGTAGCVIAHRLSQNASLDVLLVEAGPLGGPVLDVPGTLAHLQLSHVDWNYQTTSQQSAGLSLSDQRFNWPRGKLVGGSGRLNNMLFVRGHPEDYAKWFPEDSMQSVEKVEEFLKYYWKRGEDQQGKYKDNTEWHGSGGPLIASDEFYHSQLSSHIEEASREANIPKRDLNSFYTGFDHPQVNIKNGARYSTGHYLIDKLNDKPNLHLVVQTEVWKVNFLHDFEASSVIVVSPKIGMTKEIFARNGIILSGGALNTPKILQLSGVGEPEQLKGLGIRPVVASPEVGKNLQDHPGAGLDLIHLNTSLGISGHTFVNPLVTLDYIFGGTGPLTSVECEGMIIGHLGCLLKTLRKEKDFQTCDEKRRQSAPDFQLLAMPLGVTTDMGAHLYKTLGLTRSIYDEYYKAIESHTVMMFIAVCLHPKSRGFVTIDSADPSRPPVMEPNYFDHPDDLEVLLKGIRFGQQMIETPTFQRLGAKFDSRPFPPCRRHLYDSDDYWKCFIRHTTLTIYHPIGTAALGTVLDYNFRVKGTSKLFVADASAMPDLTSGNPNAMVTTLAELASDHIRHEWWLSTGFCYILEVFIPRKTLFSN